VAAFRQVAVSDASVLARNGLCTTDQVMRRFGVDGLVCASGSSPLAQSGCGLGVRGAGMVDRRTRTGPQPSSSSSSSSASSFSDVSLLSFSFAMARVPPMGISSSTTAVARTFPQSMKLRSRTSRSPGTAFRQFARFQGVHQPTLRCSNKRAERGPSRAVSMSWLRARSDADSARCPCVSKGRGVLPCIGLCHIHHAVDKNDVRPLPASNQRALLSSARRLIGEATSRHTRSVASDLFSPIEHAFSEKGSSS
jgi:hypothetical protein